MAPRKVDEKIFEDVGELKGSEPAAEPESSAGVETQRKTVVFPRFSLDLRSISMVFACFFAFFWRSFRSICEARSPRRPPEPRRESSRVMAKLKS